MHFKKIPMNNEELKDWLISFTDVIHRSGNEDAKKLLENLQVLARQNGIAIPYTANTPYVNTIRKEAEAKFPGNRDLERKLKSIIRWNAMAMVVRANRKEDGIGGHISTYQSAATLYEIGFNHFFRASTESHPGDLIFFQGHAAPGIYARSFIEGRFTSEHLKNFRHELHENPGLSSYPHPWLMPNYWQLPTVSMGLGPIMAIYQARFLKYLQNRKLTPDTDQKVWAFLGDGETDEPESLGAISLAVRERLDNLIFVINCNLQRLDGPVRGNGKIIQELEAVFKGAGWNVIKVIWGAEWDSLFAADTKGLLVERLNSFVDGVFQKYSTESGAVVRKLICGDNPYLQKLLEPYTDEQLKNLKRGGHCPEKVYAAYKSAVEHKGSPTVILAHTIKGYGLGAGGEGKNITHQQKKLNEQELRAFRDRFALPISDEQIADLPFYKPHQDSPEMKYLHARREKLGGMVPARKSEFEFPGTPTQEFMKEFTTGSEREFSTTMGFVKILGKLLRDEKLGKYIVPIVPDEARTFGIEALFRQFGIYAPMGQLYDPVDSQSLLYYKEAKDGQILEEGITEAGSMSSFIAAGTAYSSLGIPMIPFFIYYSMFGLQRIGDLAWAAGDMRTKGFLLGATAGRTTLAGEGLQHQDGQSHVYATAYPNMVCYDPYCVYELAVIIRDGIRRMYENNESIFYYLTLLNENYPQPAMPQGVEDGILKGIYLFKDAQNPNSCQAQLFGSGAIMNEALKAQDLLFKEFGIDTAVWSVTSYKQLLRDANDTDRYNFLNPTETPRVPYLSQMLKNAKGPIIAASDYMKILPLSIAKYLPHNLVSLGTDGFGRSDGRDQLRDFFEVDARHIAFATLAALYKDGKINRDLIIQAQQRLEIKPERVNPLYR